MAAMEFSSIPFCRRFNAVAASWRTLIKIAGNRYRPELHYMRGPGPKWHAKQKAGEPRVIFEALPAGKRP